MFINSRGELCRDGERIAEQIVDASDAEIMALDERARVLRNSLESFKSMLARLPERERKAALSLLYYEIKNIIFDFHISLEDSAARKVFMAAETQEGKAAVVESYKTLLASLETTYTTR